MDDTNIPQICCICADTYTSSLRKKISCPKCHFDACLNCVKRNCLNTNDVMCMNPECRAIFPITFIYKNLPLNFINGELRTHKADIILDKEKALMQATMPFVESRIQKNQVQKELDVLLKKQKDIKLEIASAREKIRNSESGVLFEKRENNTYLKKCQAPGCNGSRSS